LLKAKQIKSSGSAKGLGRRQSQMTPAAVYLFMAYLLPAYHFSRNFSDLPLFFSKTVKRLFSFLKFKTIQGRGRCPGQGLGEIFLQVGCASCPPTPHQLIDMAVFKGG